MAPSRYRTAQALAVAGFDALLLQNSLDRPTRATVDAACIAQMAVIARRVGEGSDIPLGINIHKNDGPGALAIAHAVGAAFIRVKVYTGAVLGAEGVVAGCAHETLSLRRRLDADVEVWADVHEQTSRPLAADDVISAAVDAAVFGAADALIVTQRSVPQTLEVIGRLRESLPTTRLLVGGGLDASSVAGALAVSDGAIVGRALKADDSVGGRIDVDVARTVILAARGSQTPGRSGHA